jgi:hypothetical protein
MRPLPHALPQEPQFWLSLASVLHWPLQLVWPAEQLAPVPPVPVGLLGEGVAQLAASSRQPSTTALRTVEGERGRVLIEVYLEGECLRFPSLSIHFARPPVPSRKR